MNSGQVDLSRHFHFKYATKKLPDDVIPIISANMDTIGTFDMAEALAQVTFNNSLRLLRVRNVGYYRWHGLHFLLLLLICNFWTVNLVQEKVMVDRACTLEVRTLVLRSGVPGFTTSSGHFLNLFLVQPLAHTWRYVQV